MDNLKIEVKVLSAHPDELSDEDRNLGNIALSASERAYSPYSGFSVGAAAMLGDGTIIEGSNIENCAYPSGLCAERVAMFHALSRWPQKKVLKLRQEVLMARLFLCRSRHVEHVDKFCWNQSVAKEHRLKLLCGEVNVHIFVPVL